MYTLSPAAKSADLEQLLNQALKAPSRSRTITDENNLPIFEADMLALSPQIKPALELALEYHRGQLRKGDGKQYIVHILEITHLLFDTATSDTATRGTAETAPELIITAACHDLLEDTSCPPQKIEAAFGPEVLRIVKAVSNDPELEDDSAWEQKKENYVASVRAGGPKAVIVCLADKIVNLRSLLAAWKREGDKVWSRFHRGRDKKLWFENMVLKMAREEMEKAPAAPIDPATPSNPAVTTTAALHSITAHLLAIYSPLVDELASR